MSYQALARKWRPRCFADLVGQKHVVRVLENAITRDMLHHAYLFTGTRGVGKTTLARIFAKCLNCEQDLSPEAAKQAKPTAHPCGICSTCKEIDEGRFVDLLEIDAASRTKVDQTRELLDNVPYAPIRGRYKVYLIDEVHMFSASSFNALLKTLEEPPSHVKFLLATTDPQKLPATVLSRCLQFNLKRLLPSEINQQLAHILTEEDIPFEVAALPPLAQAADGSMRDGLSLLDQAIAFSGGEVTEADVRAMLGTMTRDLILDLGEALANGNPAQVLEVVTRMADHVPDFSGVLTELLGLLHQIAVGQMVPELLRDRDADPRYRALVQAIAAEDVQLFYQIGLLGQRDLDLAPDPRVGLEMVLLRMLAFRPAAQPDRSQHQHAQPPTQPPRARPQVALPSEQPAASSQSTPKRPSAPAPDAPRSKAEPPQLANNEDWHNLVQKMGLQAMAGQLARNCELGSWDGQTLRLHLDAAKANLRAARPEENLLKALQGCLGSGIRLEVQVVRANADTPAQRIINEHTEHRQEQQTALTQDPVVKAMQETFQAQVLPESIRPLR